LPDSQFCLESKTEPEWKKNYIGGDTAQKKCILGGGDTAHTLLTRVTHGVGTPHNIERWGGDTAHTLLMGGTIGVGTPHNIERKSLAVGGWVVQVRK